MAEFEAIVKAMFEAYGSGDAALCAEFFDAECKFVAPAAPMVNGKAGTYHVFDSVDITGIPGVLDVLKAKGMAKLVHVKMDSVTPIGDSFAVTTRFVDALDAAGAVVGNFQEMIVWKKVGGKWLIFRNMFNARQ